MGIVKADRDALTKAITPGRGLCLDLGCGRAQLRQEVELRGYRYVGVDVGSEGDVIGDAHSLPFKDESFALALCIHSLEHFREPAKAISETRRVLEDSGQIIILVPWLAAFHGNDYWRYSPLGIRELLNGFEIVDLRATSGIFTLLGDFVTSILSVIGLKILTRGGGIRNSLSMLDRMIAGKIGAYAYCYLVVARKGAAMCKPPMSSATSMS